MKRRLRTAAAEGRAAGTTLHPDLDREQWPGSTRIVPDNGTGPVTLPTNNVWTYPPRFLNEV